MARSAQRVAWGWDGPRIVITTSIAVATRVSTPFEGNAGASCMMSSSNAIQRSMGTTTPSLMYAKIMPAQARNIPIFPCS